MEQTRTRSTEAMEQQELTERTEEQAVRDVAAINPEPVEKADSKLAEEDNATNGAAKADPVAPGDQDEADVQTKPVDAVKDILNNTNGEEVLDTYSSDECDVDSEDSSSSDEASDSSDSSDSESSSSSSEGEEVEEQGEADAGNDENGDDDDEEGEENGPIHSRNEVIDEKAYTLPEDFKIDEKAPLELIGEVISAVEKSVIIKAYVSGEFRILKENSVLCFEDRTLLGPLFEVFGRLQSPFYRVKFNTDAELVNFKDKIGDKVFYLVPDSQFVYTDEIKSIKGTDASNWNDEEIPEEEQEFSDDEKEAAMKQKKKKNKKKNSDKRSTVQDTQPRKMAQYKPVYADYKSVNDTETSRPAQSVEKAEQPAAIDPQEQMRKLQEQFLQIHNRNSAKSNPQPAAASAHRGQFVPPPNMQRVAPNPQTYVDVNQFGGHQPQHQPFQQQMYSMPVQPYPPQGYPPQQIPQQQYGFPYQGQFNYHQQQQPQQQPNYPVPQYQQQTFFTQGLPSQGYLPQAQSFPQHAPPLQNGQLPPQQQLASQAPQPPQPPQSETNGAKNAEDETYDY